MTKELAYLPHILCIDSLLLNWLQTERSRTVLSEWNNQICFSSLLFWTHAVCEIIYCFLGESVRIRNRNRRFHRSDVLRGMVHYVTKLVSDYDVYIIYSRIGFDGNLVISIWLYNWYAWVMWWGCPFMSCIVIRVFALIEDATNIIKIDVFK